MPNIEMTIKNPYATKTLRTDRNPTVFKRVMSRLSDEKKNPGKIIPLFAVIDNEFKIFGAITLNTGGSVSLFPDFYNLSNFDHLTLNGNFIEKKGHLTKVEIDGKRQKPLHLEASELVTGNYHLITFIFADGDLLMDAPPEIDYAVIEYQNDDERIKFNHWIDESVTAGHCIIDFPNENGFYGIQIQVIGKSNPSSSFAAESSAIENFLAVSKSLKEVIFNVRKIDIPTTEKSDFNISILTFKIPFAMKGSFAFFMAQNPSKPLPQGLNTEQKPSIS